MRAVTSACNIRPHTTQGKDVNRLLDIGFEHAGHWSLDSGNLHFDLTRHSAQANVLYAFVCDGQVKYVGKTVQPLRTRLSGYRRPAKGQSTNIKNHRRISDLISSGVAVEILALPDNGLIHYGPFHVNLAAGLEDDIIRTLNPEWNGGQPEPEQRVEAIRVSEPNADVRPLDSFSFVLQPTYYRTGFFNVGVASQEMLGADGETIELFLGDAVQPTLGTINRRAPPNGTPRIMGGTGLRDWFQASAVEKASISVEVMSPTAIRLRAPTV